MSVERSSGSGLLRVLFRTVVAGTHRHLAQLHPSSFEFRFVADLVLFYVFRDHFDLFFLTIFTGMILIDFSVDNLANLVFSFSPCPIWRR